MSVCSNCHNQLSEGAQFCMYCGAPVVPDQGRDAIPEQEPREDYAAVPGEEAVVQAPAYQEAPDYGHIQEEREYQHNAQYDQAPHYPQQEYYQPEQQQPEYEQPEYHQPEYHQPEYHQPEYQQPYQQTIVPPEYKPLGAWQYFGLQILFAIPLVGLILLIVFAVGGTRNLNLRNFARSYFIWLLIGAIMSIAFAIYLAFAWREISEFVYSFGDFFEEAFRGM